MAIHSVQSGFSADPIVTSSTDASDEQFHPAPLSWLIAWLFRPKHDRGAHDSEQLDEHISGLA